MTQTHTSLARALPYLVPRALNSLIGELPPDRVAATLAEGHARMHYPELHPEDDLLVSLVPETTIPELMDNADAELLKMMQALAALIVEKNLVLAGCPSPVSSPSVYSFSASQYGKGAGLRATIFFDTELGRECIRFDVFAIPPDAKLPTVTERL